ERLVRELVLQMKLGRVDLGALDQRYGRAMTARFDEPLGRLADEGLLAIDGRRVRLTYDGLARVDHLLPSFYLPQHRDIRYS
ncbi:MAG TPA: hypothetical protein VD788_17880, partial [Candidatus Polarisedimenticolaceae bacterium]|nr:hypothetical protein [Candidatus Polarisedimenticolaceae bacterium]